MYLVTIDIEARDQIEKLPDEALLPYADVLTVLELLPWSGPSIHEGNPEGEVRQFVFGRDGQGLVNYLILEDQLRVDVLKVMWFGSTS